MLGTLCREADEALGGDLAGVYLGDAERGGSAVAGHGIARESDWWGYTIKPGEGVGGQVLITGEPAISNDYQHEVEMPSLGRAARRRDRGVGSDELGRRAQGRALGGLLLDAPPAPPRTSTPSRP